MEVCKGSLKGTFAATQECAENSHPRGYPKLRWIDASHTWSHVLCWVARRDEIGLRRPRIRGMSAGICERAFGRFRTCRPEKKKSRKLRVHAALASSPWQTARLPCICSAVAKTAARRFNGDTKTEAPNPHHYLGFITCDRISPTLKVGIKWLS